MSAFCKECGAALEGRVTKSGLVTCRYCGSGHDVRELANEGRPTLIAAVDFSGESIEGWATGEKLSGRPIGGSPPAWSVTQVRDGLNHAYFIAPGSFEDFDATMCVRFLPGDPDDGVFLKARTADAGAVTVHLFRGGAVTLGWQQPIHQWKDNVVTARPAKPLVEGEWWRLRWVGVGARHRVYLNGALVLTATHEPIRHSGTLDFRLRVIGESLTVELSELAVHEPAP